MVRPVMVLFLLFILALFPAFSGCTAAPAHQNAPETERADPVPPAAIGIPESEGVIQYTGISAG